MDEKCAAKVIIQQCIQASVKVQPDSAELEKIDGGIVAYVCFLKNATQDTVDKMVNTVTTVKLSRNDDGQLVSIIDLPGSILIIPQATLGGKLKGKRMQYHSNIDKSDGLNLYENFVKGCKVVLSQRTNNDDKAVVKCGTYGSLQVVKVNTNGPYTHIVEFT